MQLNSARQAWHDCQYTAWDSQGAFIEQLGLLGAMVQTTDRQRTASHAAHQALAGQVQSAIGKLHSQVRAFGNFMYSPRLDDDTRETAEEVIFNLVQTKSPRMTAAKREKLEYVVKGVMARYRYMHQGGQSANEDPLASPEGFRAWMDAHYGIVLESRNWERDWGDVIRVAFECCEDLDRDALSPVAAAIYEMRRAA
ncbi:hypothetical protein LU674_013070 [Pseudomonas alloputida]|uniref:Prophage PssSM-02 n=1 Tax=Pseudomonas alloputida TaxID=1940621 RepID=A0AAW7HLA5_9PSED|nr:hypothetical protein [Pseudomonas alloputida]MCE0860704.1 hypothetical protein [Pseudomonas alloputida]MCE0866727.1 hypothetical protein [Pseudomonas alloputida]MCE0889861.1 hypothetical protein [Pseudomonas alloputida]MCE0919072.1 hypothetical protein [Pseudomonas alloputida]MCE1045587.1 hypothetical protein [Pseudomonas alloputida]